MEYTVNRYPAQNHISSVADPVRFTFFGPLGSGSEFQNWLDPDTS